MFYLQIYPYLRLDMSIVLIEKIKLREIENKKKYSKFIFYIQLNIGNSVQRVKYCMKHTVSCIKEFTFIGKSCNFVFEIASQCELLHLSLFRSDSHYFPY